jgi:four helix bundle protein
MKYHYEELTVWKNAMKLFLKCHSVSVIAQEFRDYALANQLQRSSLSIPSNIAEGREGGSQKIFLRHIKIALGSAAELKTQLMCAKELGYLSSEKYMEIETVFDDTVLPLYKLRNKLMRSVQA